MPLNVVMKGDVVIFISYKLNLLLLHKTKRLELLMVMRTESNALKLQSQMVTIAWVFFKEPWEALSTNREVPR